MKKMSKAESAMLKSIESNLKALRAQVADTISHVQNMRKNPIHEDTDLSLELELDDLTSRFESTQTRIESYLDR